MSRLQKLQLRQSEVRTRIGEILDLETRSEEEDGQLRELKLEIRSIESDIQAALLIEPEPETRREANTGDGEDREKLELRSKFSIGRVIGAIAGKNALDGVEAEYMDAAGVENGSVPTDVFETRQETGKDLETRAITPGVEGSTNQRPIVPAIFQRTVLPFLNIGMPSAGVGDVAFPVLSTSVASGAGAVAKDAAVDSTAGAFTVSTQQPRRLGAQFSVRYEDLARLQGMEEALRTNIQQVVGDVIDTESLNGAGAAYNTDGEIRGLLAQLADPTDPDTGAETWARYHTAAVSHLSDPWATTEAGVRLLLGEETYRHAAGQFRATESNESFTAYWNRVGGGCRISGKLAAPTGDVQQAVVVRANAAGDPSAVMPHWASFDLTVRDIYTQAGKGQVIVTVHVLVGDVVLLRSDRYVQDSFRLA